MRPLLVFLSFALISCSSTPDSKAPETQAAGGQAYLDKAAAEPGAVKTASGLVYRELRAGTGASPSASDTVRP
jgi:FKBP-type peptidyl-prolyl cis-trans isomerase